MNQSITWKLVPAEPTSNWTNAFAARGPRIGTFDTTIRDVLETAPAPAFDLQQALQGVRAALAFLPPADAAIAGLDRIIAIFGGAPATTQEDTLARTGNTADHQEGWYAGIDHERAEARAGVQDDTKDVPPAMFGDEAHVSIPIGLIGAACSAIEKKRDAPKTLAELRRYTFGDLSRPAPAAGDARDAERYRHFRTALTSLDSSWLDKVGDALEAMGLDPDDDVLPTAEQVDAAFDAAQQGKGDAA